MYEYTLCQMAESIKNNEAHLNELARLGYRVVNVLQETETSYPVVILEREVLEQEGKVVER